MNRKNKNMRRALCATTIFVAIAMIASAVSPSADAAWFGRKKTGGALSTTPPDQAREEKKKSSRPAQKTTQKTRETTPAPAKSSSAKSKEETKAPAATAKTPTPPAPKPKKRSDDDFFRKETPTVATCREALERAQTLYSEKDFKAAYGLAEQIASAIKKNELDVFGDDGKGENADIYEEIFKAAVEEARKCASRVKREDPQLDKTTRFVF